MVYESVLLGSTAYTAQGIASIIQLEGGDKSPPGYLSTPSVSPSGSYAGVNVGSRLERRRSDLDLRDELVYGCGKYMIALGRNHDLGGRINIEAVCERS